MLAPAAVDAVLVAGLGVPLGPAMEQLHARFRDKRSAAQASSNELYLALSRFSKMTNYERLMRYLEERREERQRLGPEEVRDWTEAMFSKRQPFRFNNTPALKQKYDNSSTYFVSMNIQSL